MSCSLHLMYTPSAVDFGSAYATEVGMLGTVKAGSYDTDSERHLR